MAGLDDGVKVFAVLSVHESPKELFSNEDQHRFHCRFPLPLPDFLVCFTVGSWQQYSDGSAMQIKVVLDEETEPVSIGVLSEHNRSLYWQEAWPDDFFSKSLQMQAQGRMAKLEVTVGDIQKESSCTMDSGLDVELLTAKDLLLQTDKDIDDVQKLVEESKLGESDKNTFITPKVEKLKSKSESKSARGSNKKKRKPSDDSAEITPNSTSKKTKSVSKTRRLQEEWKQSPGKNNHTKVPSERWGHTLCMIGTKEALLVGGQGPKQQLSKDSVWILETEKKSWKTPTIVNSDNNKAQYRMGHTATYDPVVKCVYVFGGSKNLRWYSDIHVLDVESWTWSLVQTNGKAPTRAYHSTTLYRNELFVFGGVYPNPDPEPDGCSNQLHVYNPANESWYEPIVMGDKPLPRSGHSATPIGDKLVIFGGWDAPVSYNDLSILDLGVMDFVSPSVIGTPPSPRSWHVAIGLSNNRVLIHGGYSGDHALGDSFIYQLGTSTWITLKNPLPITPRAGHTIICTDSSEKENTSNSQEMIVFGGGNNEDSFHNQLTVFKVSMQS
ncbi:kelch domain-containing protein 2-like [Glandiceps talaboti]